MQRAPLAACIIFCGKQGPSKLLLTQKFAANEAPKMCLGTKLNSSKMKNWQEAVGSQAGTEALNSWLLHNLDSRSRWMAILHSEHALSGCDDLLMTPAMTWIGRMTRTVDPGRALAPLLAPGPELRKLGSSNMEHQTVSALLFQGLVVV